MMHICEMIPAARRRVAAVAACGTFTLGACDNDEASILLPRDAVVVTPAQLTLAVGDSVLVHAKSVRDDASGRATGARITFVASSAVLAVRPRGDSAAVVTGVASGVGSLTAISSLGYTVTVPVTVRAR